MSNICENTLQVMDENPENVKVLKDFMRKAIPYCDIDDTEDALLCIYFDSKWDFPEEVMNQLYEELPNKDSIDMTCLSVEWGGLYCCFHTCDKDGWHFIP